MLRTSFIFASLFIAIACASEFSVLSSTAKLSFRDTDALGEKIDSIDEEGVIDVIGASLGTAVTGYSNWPGLVIRSPFDLPKSAIVIVADGISHLHAIQRQSYRLMTNNVNEILNSLLNDFVTCDDQKLIEEKNPADNEVIQSSPCLNATIEKLNRPGQEKTLQILKVSLNSENEKQIRELVDLSQVSNVLLVAIASKGDKSRTRRQVSTQTELDKLNLAEHYSEDYPAIFNIILWLMVAFFFSLLAICYVIADMDPGRDSIIYRMTSTRMKKDN